MNFNQKRPHPAIPEHAEMVFRGVRSEVYQWNQKMYDNSTARFERIRFLDGAFVIPILENGNILLTRQSQPTRSEFIALPGGGVEDDDASPLEAAKRELLEEVGAVSDDWHPWYTFHGTANVATFVDYFIARNCKIIQPITEDAGEKISYFEVSFDEFLQISLQENFANY